MLLHLVEVAKDLATSVSSAGLLVVHDAVGGGEDEVAELARGEDVGDPLVELGEFDIEAGGHDTALVESANEGDDDLAAAVVIDDLVLADVAVGLHHIEELEDNLGAGADHNLTLVHLLGVDDNLEGISKNVSTHHFELRSKKNNLEMNNQKKKIVQTKTKIRNDQKANCLFVFQKESLNREKNIFACL